MPGGPLDAHVRRLRADALLQATAEDLKALLKEAAQELRPFPYFLGSWDTQAVEADPGRAGNAERGCVVVCPDGELYELTVRISVPTGADAAFVPEREDQLKKLELPPQEYIPYAYSALCELTRLLQQKQRPE